MAMQKIIDEYNAANPAYPMKHIMVEQGDLYTYAITWPRYELLSWYYQLGGKLTENGTDPAFANETFEKVFQDFADAVAKGWCTQDGDQPNNLFAKKKLIFLPEGTWILSTAQYTRVNFGETYMISYDPNNMVR